MRIKTIILDNLSQIYAIIEKETKLHLRIKINVILGSLMHVLGLIIPWIIMNQIFTLAEEFGPWNSSNFMVFMLTLYQIAILNRLINVFGSNLRREKAWKTLPALIIAPFNRINLLFGLFFTHLLITSIPFVVFFAISYIFYPISIVTILSIFTLYFFLALVFSGIGLVIAGLAVSRESYVRIVNIAVELTIWFSCLGMPFEFFPGYFQNVVVYGPSFCF